MLLFLHQPPVVFSALALPLPLSSHSFPTVFLFKPDLFFNLIILFLRNVLLHAAALLRVPTPYARKRLSPSTRARPAAPRHCARCRATCRRRECMHVRD